MATKGNLVLHEIIRMLRSTAYIETVYELRTMANNLHEAKVLTDAHMVDVKREVGFAENRI